MKKSRDITLLSRSTALSTEVAQTPQAGIEKIRASYQGAIDKTPLDVSLSARGLGAAFTPLFGAVGTTAVGMAIAAGGPVEAIFCAAVAGLAFPVAAMSALVFCAPSIESYVGEKRAVKKLESAHHNLEDLMIRTQKNSYRENQKKLIGLADQSLREGNLLTEEQMAYLAAVNPEDLEGASLPLAISVYQARKMLARFRDPVNVAPPLTANDLGLRTNVEAAREIMLEKLKAADVRIDEDDGPACERIELALPELSFKRSKGSKVLRAIFSEFTSYGDVKKFRAQKFAELPPVPVPALHPADGFAEALATCGRKLDLPALRGWPQMQKALLKPSAF